MKLPDKIIKLRRAQGWSQEELAERLDISRQAISRWENGTALPDVQNVLQLSKLFCVTTDYLLNDDCESDGDIPAVKSATKKAAELLAKERKHHLIAAICFTIASLCWLVTIVNYVNTAQLAFSCIALGICGINAGLQFGLFVGAK